MSGKSGKFSDLFDKDVIESTYTDSKGISSFDGGEVIGAPLADGGNGDPLLGLGVNGRRHVRRTVRRRRFGGSGGRIGKVFSTATDEGMIGDKGDISIFLSLAGTGSAESGLHHSLLNGGRVSLIQLAIERDARLVGDRDKTRCRRQSKVSSSKVNLWSAYLGSNMRFLWKRISLKSSSPSTNFGQSSGWTTSRIVSSLSLGTEQ